MRRLDGGSFAAGAAAGAAVVFIVWIISSFTPEPPGRHSLLFDQCLAQGRTVTACDAVMRVIRARVEHEPFPETPPKR
jgi:hypothetical protein